MKPTPTPTQSENEPPPGANPKGLLIGIGLMLVVLMLYGLGRPAPPEAAEKAPEPTPVEPEEETKKQKGVMGLMMADPEEIERERQEVLKAEKEDLVARQKKMVEDFGSYNVGSRFLGDAVMSEGAARSEVRATIVAKSGSVLDGTALLVVKAETDDHRYVNELVAKYPEPVRSGGSRRKYERFRVANLSPRLRFARVTSPGVPKRKGPLFFSSDAFSVGFTPEGHLKGTASRRYGNESTGFTLRPADALVADTPAEQWKNALTPGALWRGQCEQFKRMGYNEVPLSESITVAVASGRDDDERLLVVSREENLQADRSVVRLKRGDPRSIGGWHWVGARETPSLVATDAYGGKNFLVDRRADTGVPVAARLTDGGKLVLRFGPIGSAVLTREGFTPTESTDSVARRAHETLQPEAVFDGSVTIPPEHYEGDRREAKPVVLRARLVVTQASGAGWKFRLEVPGAFAHTAEFRGELVDDRFERVRFPLRLVRTSLVGGRKSSRRGVCLLAQDAEKSPVIWLRVAERDGQPQLVGRTPAPNNETLLFTPSAPEPDRASDADAIAQRSTEESRSQRMLASARPYLRSSKPAVVKKGRERLQKLLAKYPTTAAAAEAQRLLKR